MPKYRVSADEVAWRTARASAAVVEAAVVFVRVAQSEDQKNDYEPCFNDLYDAVRTLTGEVETGREIAP